MPHTDRRKFLKAASAAGIAGLAGCSNMGSFGGGGGGGSNGGTIKIGMVTALSGAYAQLGNRTKWAIQQAVDDINDDGGINDKNVKLLTRDSELDTSVAVRKGQELTQSDNVDLLCGPAASSVALSLIPISTRSKTPYFAGNAAARSITGGKCGKYAYRGMRNHAEMQALALAPYMYDQGYKTASIVYADYAWGQSERDWFEDVFTKQGGKIKSKTATPLGTSDYSQYMSKIDTSADAVFIALAGTDAINFLQAAANFGLKDKMKLTGTGAAIGGALNAAGKNANGVLVCNYYTQGMIKPLDFKGNKEFRKKYRTYSDGENPTRYSTGNYEAIKAFAKAAKESGYPGDTDADGLTKSLDGLEMKKSYDFPQGDKHIRGDDNQCMLNQFIVEIKNQKEQYVKTIPISTAEKSQHLCSS